MPGKLIMLGDIPLVQNDSESNDSSKHSNNESNGSKGKQYPPSALNVIPAPNEKHSNQGKIIANENNSIEKKFTIVNIYKVEDENLVLKNI